MSAVESAVVFFPRYTTLVGGNNAEYATAPLDVSAFGGVQIEVWWSDMMNIGGGSNPEFALVFEESLDGVEWLEDASKKYNLLEVLVPPLPTKAISMRSRR